MPCEGTWLVLYTKDHARSKMRPLYVKIMVYRPFSLAVGRLKKKKKKKEKMEKIAVWSISTLAMFSTYFVSVSRYRKALEYHS